MMFFLLFLFVLSQPVTVDGGITFYDYDGSDLGCWSTHEPEEWVALPVEWFRLGYVECGDIAYITFRDGTTWHGPVMDSGCHLHWPVWDTDKPMLADLPGFMRDRLGPVPTGTGTLRVYRRRLDEWWDRPSMLAWDTVNCREGPLTWTPEQSEYAPE
jgi:hypothetical protein